MKTSTLLLCCLFAAPAAGQPCPEALFTYWEFKERLHKHFVRLDGHGDGIGQWDEDKLRYTKAGFSLPALDLYVQTAGCNYWQYGSKCYRPLDVASNCHISNVLIWNDSPVDLGYYLALLASEYELLRKNQQHDQSQATLQELWLALQAYRRLDMTANRLYDLWRRRYDPDCTFNQTTGVCGGSFDDPRFDGYSGFFLRSDVPHDFRHWFNANSDGNKDWEVGGVMSGYACKEDSVLEKFISNGEPRSGGNVVSQDQMIGILLGLGFVKRFVPERAVVHGDTVLRIAQNIALGMLNHIEAGSQAGDNYRSIRYPACLRHLKVDPGGNASNFFLGINTSIAYIKPGAPVCTDGVDGQKWEAFGKNACDCNLPFYENCGFNCRMLLELLAVGDEGSFEKFQQKAVDVWKEGLILARYLLHDDKYDITDIKPIVKQKMTEAVCEHPPSCHGPCYRGLADSEPFFECPNQPGWCHENRFRASVVSHVYCDYTYNRLASIRGNGVDFMLMHNLNLLTWHPDAPFFNPENVEGEVRFRLPDIIEGEPALCPPDEKTFSIAPDFLPFDEIEWEASSNLSIIAANSAEGAVTLRTTPGADSVGWLKVKVSRNECDHAWCWQKIRLGKPSKPLLENAAEGCDFSVCLANDDHSLYDLNWKVSNHDSTDYFLDLADGCAALELLTGLPGSVNFEVSFANSCGEEAASQTFEVDCDDRLKKEIFVSPNPARSTLDVHFKNISPEKFYGQPVFLNIYDPFSRLVKSEQVHRRQAQVDVSGLESGLFFIQAAVSGKSFSAKFVKG